ncbi:MAG: DUF6575 domain-containing protein, partial [Rhabdochlamydiaceae bacterium]
MSEESEEGSESPSNLREPSIDEFYGYLKNFESIDEFVHYDFPRVFSAKSPKGEYWLFKWLTKSKDYERADIWLAFQISEARLNSLRNGTTSLREAISLAKGNLYAFDGND